MVMQNPLVSFCVVTYNQERYVRDAVASALRQTYPNLEVIISDDASKDGTWDIIQEVVAEEVDKGCKHKIVLNRNEKNMGIAEHWEFVDSLCHGELKFMAAGDDISTVDRAEKVVRAWLGAEKKPAAIIHSGVTIDVRGKKIGHVRAASLDFPLGAVTVWKRFPELKFPRAERSHAVEDVIASARARMLGGELIIPDELLEYRIGSGLTTGRFNKRRPALMCIRLWCESFSQIFADLEYMRTIIGEKRYEGLKAKYLADQKYAKAYVELLTAKSFGERKLAHAVVRERKNGVKERVLIALYLLPQSMGDVLLNSYALLKYCFDFYRKHG